MNSTHFKDLFEILSRTILSVIKQKLSRYNIRTSENEEFIFIFNPKSKKCFEPKKIKMFSSELIEFEDNTSVEWEEIKNFNDLLSILEYVENWLKIKANEFIQIEWSIYDFEDRAKEMEENENGETNQLYDRSKFPFALKIFEEQHDYNLGLCWADVDFHLNEYCKLDDSRTSS